MPDPMATRATGDSFGVAMEDLSEKDQKDLELQREMEEVTAEWWRKKLACF
jgi:hypothetical protein